jgi:hypothetical protein
MTRTLPLRRPRRLAALAVLVPAALGFTAAQARAAGETITMVQNDPSAVVGRATNFTASGALNPDDTMFGFGIYIFLKDADRDPTCGASFEEESATAMHSGYESWVSPATGFQVGMGPTFNQPFKITFAGSGNYLLCGYVQGDFSTFAAGELRGVVAPEGGGTPTPPPAPAALAPVAVRAPWITRKGRVLTCHAGTWQNGPSSLSYGWYVKGHSRKVAAHSKLKVRHALRGRKVSCRVTAANAAGGRTAASKAIRAR